MPIAQQEWMAKASSKGVREWWKLGEREGLERFLEEDENRIG